MVKRDPSGKRYQRRWDDRAPNFPDADTERAVRKGLAMPGTIESDIKMLPATRAFGTESHREQPSRAPMMKVIVLGPAVLFAVVLFVWMNVLCLTSDSLIAILAVLVIDWTWLAGGVWIGLDYWRSRR